MHMHGDILHTFDGSPQNVDVIDHKYDLKKTEMPKMMQLMTLTILK